MEISEEKVSAKRPSIFTFTAIVVAIVIIFFLTFWYFNVESQKSFYTQLYEKNNEFAYAEGLLKSKKYDEAADHFRLALEKAEGYKEEGQLKYKIAISESEGSNPIEGIALLKEIASNDNYTPMIRAYAVQYIGNLLYTYNTTEIKNKVFENEPYKSFLTGGDYSLARYKLFEYASSFYPLGIAELRIAKWYSTEVLKLAKSGASDEITKNKILEMKSIIGQKLANADKYLLDISKDEQAGVYVPEVLYRKGNVLTDLYLSDDKSFGNPEESYKQSLSIVSITPSAEAAAKLRYAVFLARMYGETRIDDIKKLLNDFSEGTKYTSTNTVRSIKNEKDGALGNKEDYLLLAKIDIRFAQFLKALGWII